MEKELFTSDQLAELDNLTIMLYAAPVIVASVLIEWLVGMYKKRNYYHGKDFLAALGIGAGSALVGASIKIVLFTTSMMIYNAVPWAIPRSWWGFVAGFVAVDFFRYWAHRISHEQRFWWATHVTHHSSEKMNFGISLRTSWVAPIKFLFFLPVPFLGFDPFTFFVCHQLAVLYQFWVHTELIKKLPAPIEYVFVTPSHHRVHHGSNPKYIDKNYGSTFIFWDRLFGTFQGEEERPTYGLTTPVKSYNPIYLVFHEFMDMGRDLLHARTFREAWDVLFKPPGALVTEYQREQQAQAMQQDAKAENTSELQSAGLGEDREDGGLGESKVECENELRPVGSQV